MLILQCHACLQAQHRLVGLGHAGLQNTLLEPFACMIPSPQVLFMPLQLLGLAGALVLSCGCKVIQS